MTVGMDQTVTFDSGAVPTWAAVRDLLAGRGYPVEMRMIDGELALPDEMPAEPWRELRVASAQGMVTLRRAPNAVVCVTWGNAQGPLRQVWDALAWAFAEAGGGRVATPQGPQTAGEFQRRANLPDVLRPATG